jgi:hypothetical protein
MDTQAEADLKATKFVKRDDWAPGPWDSEDDRYEWRTAAGLTGLIIRGPLGALCGYVGVEPGHVAYGRSCDSADSYERGEDGAIDYDRPKNNPVRGLEVHGGVTYADHCAGRICHVPAPGEPEHLWWIGFDCSHSQDVSPEQDTFWMRHNQSPLRYPGSSYRDVDYVRAEVESLSAQLAALAVASQFQDETTHPGVE